VIAARNLKNATSIGVGSLLDVLHPGAVYGEGNVVFRFTGDSAGVTADALTVIDDESVSHPEVVPTRRRRWLAACVLYLTGALMLLTGLRQESSDKNYSLECIALLPERCGSYATIRSAFPKANVEEDADRVA
jgi:hypothetical protein